MLAIARDRTGGTPRWTSLFLKKNLKKNGRQQDKRHTAKVPSKIERILIGR